MNEFDKQVKKEKWIISISNTGGDEAELLNFTGTEDEAKQLLAGLSAKDMENAGDRFDYGTDGVDEVERLDNNALYAYGSYIDYHIDYVAKRVADIREITLQDVPAVIKEETPPLMCVLERLGVTHLICHSFSEAENNDRKENIVLLSEARVHFTYKYEYQRNGEWYKEFGELLSFVPEEFEDYPESTINEIEDFVTNYYKIPGAIDNMLFNDENPEYPLVPYNEDYELDYE